jgi:uridine kinase
MDHRRDEMLARLAARIEAVPVAHPTRVAIDGPPAAGKTTLADELAVRLRASGRSIIRATVDDFLMPRAQRYRRGEYSAEGCYFDAHDREALKRMLLDPLGPGGDRSFRTAVDHRPGEAAVAPADAVLLFDGVFLLRPELIDRWELTIFLAVDLEETVKRAAIRDPGADVERRWRERYLPAQQLYFAAVGPARQADIVVHDDHLPDIPPT